MSIEKLVKSKKTKPDLKSSLKNDHRFAYLNVLLLTTGIFGIATLIYGAYNKDDYLIKTGAALLGVGVVGLAYSNT